MSLIRKFKNFFRDILLSSPRFWVNVLYKDIWKFRKKLQEKRALKEKTPGSCKGKGWKLALYDAYWMTYGSFIGIDAELEDKPIFPHRPLGVFISNMAHIGKKCVIFQQVTIGSNSLKGSKNQGAPYLENGVYIGCGAKIIGNVKVGRNARIGANCVVVKDIPANSVTVIRGIETIQRDEELNNEYTKTSRLLNG